MAGERWLRGLGQPPQPRPAGHQPAGCTGRPTRIPLARRDYGPVTVNGNTFAYQQSTRPYFSKFPNFGIINQINSAASSSYNAMQVTLRSSSWHGLSSQFAYAWSHNLDNSSVFNTIPQNSLNLAGDRGNANQDIRNHFTALSRLRDSRASLGTEGSDARLGGQQHPQVPGRRAGQRAHRCRTTAAQPRARTVPTSRDRPSTATARCSRMPYAQYLNPNSFAVPASWHLRQSAPQPGLSDPASATWICR